MRRTKGFRRSKADSRTKELTREGNQKGRRFQVVKRRLDKLEEERAAAVARLNAEYARKAAPMAQEYNELGNRLHDITTALIPLLNPEQRHVQLRSIRLSFRQASDRLVVTDKAAALKRIANLGWARQCVKLEPKIQLTPLKRKLTAEGRRRRMKGTRWEAGETFLYVNDDKVDLEQDDQAINSRKEAA